MKGRRAKLSLLTRGMWEALPESHKRTKARLMLTSEELGRPILRSVHHHHQNSFQLSNKSVFLESCIARQSTTILDSFNTSNLTSLDLSVLQDPSRFKDRVPGNLNQSGGNPERRQFDPNVPETEDLVHPGPHARHYLRIARPMYCSSVPFHSETGHLRERFANFTILSMISLFRNLFFFFTP